jgi:hypothetical protein
MASCGYSLSSKSNPHISTVAVPLFENETLEKGIEEILTQEIIDVLQENRQLQLTDEKRSDSVIYGTIIEYKRTPYSYDSNENVQQYKIEIIARVEYEDRKNQKTLWSQPRMLGWGTYFAVPVDGQQVEEEVDAQQRAVEKLAEDIKTKTVEGW